MPGTFGSLAGSLLFFAVSDLSSYAHAGITAGIILVSILVAGKAVKGGTDDDPKWVVCDEISGIFVAHLFVPYTFFSAILVFLLFRFFDILKPYPVGYIDRNLKGGPGIVIDDVMAGIYANICAQIAIIISVKWLI